MNQLDVFVSILDDGLKEIVGEVDVLDISRQEVQQVFGACLLCRVTTNLTGVRILHRSKLPLEADTLLRSGLESIFWLGAISRDSAFIEKIKKQDNQSKKLLAKNVLKHTVHLTQLSADTIEAVRQRGENKTPDGGLGRLEIEEAATAAGLEAFYPTYLSLSNQSAHPSAASLNKHLTLENDELSTIDLVPNEPDWLETMSLAAALVLYTGHYLNEIFPRAERAWPDRLWARYKTSSDDAA
jgi:hypothetical protein